jgi:hypothetical protein
MTQSTDRACALAPQRKHRSLAQCGLYLFGVSVTLVDTAGRVRFYNRKRPLVQALNNGPTESAALNAPTVLLLLDQFADELS